MRRRTFLSLCSGAVGAGAVSTSLIVRLESLLAKLPVVDTHEHTLPEAVRVARPIDFFTLAGHYLIRDVVSAGLTAADAARVRDPAIPASERWGIFEPFWRWARFTGYGQCLRLAMRDVYGVEEIDAASLPRLNAAIAARNKPGLYRELLKHRTNIEYAVLDQTFPARASRPDPEFFVVAARFDRFVLPPPSGGVAALEELTGRSIATLAEWKRALEDDFARTRKLGMVAVKSLLASRRPLYFEPVPEADARNEFESMMRAKSGQPSRKLQDHLFHHLVALAAEHRLPMQIHTGLLSANGGNLPNTNPVHLATLFGRYPQVKFDLFHIGYPYQSEMAVLAKWYPNVCVDFCWAHIVAPQVAQRALHEFLETVPYNKIMGFGGDFDFPELTYAHAVMARRNIAAVLAERVEDGIWKEEDAADVGRMLLHENPARLFPKA